MKCWLSEMQKNNCTITELLFQYYFNVNYYKLCCINKKRYSCT